MNTYVVHSGIVTVIHSHTGEFKFKNTSNHFEKKYLGHLIPLQTITSTYMYILRQNLYLDMFKTGGVVKREL